MRPPTLRLAPVALATKHLQSTTPWSKPVAFVVLVLALMLALAGRAAADTLAVSTGTMVVDTSTNRFLPVTATGDACLTADTPRLSAPATNYVGNFGAPVRCMNDFFVRSANQPSIFYTYYDFKRYRGFEGATGAAKFPAPAFGSAALSVLDGPVRNDTLVVANGSFGSSQQAIGNVVLFRSASLHSDATVTRNAATSPTGIATARTYDPWLFTPLEDTELSLSVRLEDITVRTVGTPGQDGAAIFQAFGAFGRGSVPGVDTMLTWQEDSFIGATGGSMQTIGSRTIFDNTADPLRLYVGQTYWLTAATQAGAVALVPEPSSLMLAVAGLAGVVGALTWRRGSARRIAKQLLQGTVAIVVLAGNVVHAADPDAGYTYNVQGKHSNRVLDVTGGPAALLDDIQIQQFDLLGSYQTNQRFRLVRETDGFYTLRAQHSGKCAEVAGGVGATGNGAKVMQSECNGRDHQRWRLRELDGGFFRLDAKHSGKSLDVEGGPTATGNGAKLQQWDWLNGDNQKFRFIERSKTVACIAPTNDGFVSQGEGFERVGFGAADRVQNGGAIRDCLALVEDGDSLVIVAHGNKGLFEWGNNQYTGFRAQDGAQPAPVPERFAERRKVSAKLLSCFSGAAPDRGIALTDSLFAALGGAGRGHAVRGYSGLAATGIVKGLMGGTPAQRTQAEAALDANGAPWLDNPPVNRPGATTTHLTAAQAIVDRAVGAGIVTVVIPNARGETRKIGGYTNAAPDVVRQRVSAPADAAETCGVIEASTIFMPDDVSNRAMVLRGGLRYHYATRRFVQTVVLRNVGTSALAAPISIVLDDLSGNATLVGATGTTVSMTPSGSPYLDADLGSAGVLAPGASVNVVLQFDNPSLSGITYLTRVLAGTGQR